MRWKHTTMISMFLLAVGAGPVLAAQDADDPRVRQAIALAIDPDALIEQAVPFGAPESPFGVPLDLGDDAVVAGDVRAFGARLVDDAELNRDIFGDGSTTAGSSYTYGGIDDTSAILGDHLFVSIGATLPSGQLDQFVEFAVALTLPGLPVATADPNLANDPNVSHNARFGVSWDGEQWVTTYEQFNNAWQPFQNPADVGVFVDGGTMHALFVIPPRFAAGAVAAETFISSFPLNATDPSQAFFTRATPSTPVLITFDEPGARARAEFLPIADAIIGGDPAAGVVETVEVDDATGEDADGTDTASENEVVAEQPTENADPVAADIDENDTADAPTDGANGAPDAAIEPDGAEQVAPVDAVDQEGNAVDQEDSGAAIDAESPAAGSGDEAPNPGDESEGGGLNPAVPIGGAVLVIVVAGIIIKVKLSDDAPSGEAGVAATTSPSDKDDDDSIDQLVDDESETFAGICRYLIAGSTQEPDENGEIVVPADDLAAALATAWAGADKKNVSGLDAITKAAALGRFATPLAIQFPIRVTSITRLHLNVETFEVRADYIEDESTDDGPPIELNEATLANADDVVVISTEN